jgi:hypothetical protein
MFDLRALRRDAIAAIELYFNRFEGAPDPATLVKDVERLCLHFHVIAAAGLLVDADPEKLFVNLCRSAENWRRLLGHCGRQGWPRPPASRMAPLFGAVAAGAWPMAVAIAASAEPARSEDEYEDEHRYALLFQELAAAGRPDPGLLARRIADLEAVDEGSHASRIALARALGAGDAAAFSEAFAGAHSAHERETERRARAFGTPHTAFAPYRYLWLEGLAWLRLGERAGLTVEGEIRYCPPLARGVMRGHYAGEWALPIES